MFTFQKFVYQDNAISVMIDAKGNPWFDAPSVCKVLGYVRDASNVLEKLEDDEKILLDRKKYSDPTPAVGSESDYPSEGCSEIARKNGGAQKKWFVNEPGLYSLILGSEKPEARQFKRWITHEVLPGIRKTGSYTLTEKQPETPYTPPTLEQLQEAARSHNKWEADVSRLLDEVVKWNNILDPEFWSLVKRVEALEKPAKKQLVQVMLNFQENLEAEAKIIRLIEEFGYNKNGKRGMSWSLLCRYNAMPADELLQNLVSLMGKKLIRRVGTTKRTTYELVS